jgi:cell division protein FtsQ
MDGEMNMNGQKTNPEERIPKIRQLRKPKANRGLIILALLFFVVFLFIIYFQSDLSRLNMVVMENNHFVNQEDVLKEARLEIGMFYFDFKTEEVEKIIEAMPMVKSAEVIRDLPNRLLIRVQEYPVVALWSEEDGLFPVLSNGYILGEKVKQGKIEHPILNGWPHRDGVKELSGELEKLSPSVTHLISEIVLTPSLSDPYRLTLYMVDGFEVITSIRKFSENMSWYPHIRDQLLAEGKNDSVIYLLEGKWVEQPVTEDQQPEEGDGTRENED